MAQNTYLVADQSQVVIIDPGFNGEAALSQMTERGWTLAAVLLTHGHFDHFRGLRLLAKERTFPVYIHEKDAENFSDRSLNGAMYFNGSFSLPPSVEVRSVHDGDVLTFGNLTFSVLHTPGHSPGSVCYRHGKMLFSGDTLFCGDVGRTDLVGGNPQQLRMSLEKLFTGLGNDVVVLPGHEEATTIGSERMGNPMVPARLRRI
jgi:glyoxylase-like metal-dependent hydrolase (beta-lactamase superfamily II)